MANNASAKKCIRQSERHRLHNKYYAKTTRNAIRAIRNTTDKKVAQENAPKVYAMIDKLAKKGSRPGQPFQRVKKSGQPAIEK